MAIARSRNLLLFLLALTFSGAVSLLNTISPLLLPAYIAALLACSAICVLADPSLVERSASMWPYAAFLLFFFAWGTLFSADRAEVLPNVLRFIGKDFLILGAVAVAIVDRRHMTRFAGMVQFAVIINLAISIWQLIDPGVLVAMANALEQDNQAFSASRPAGLWINPNLASFALILGVLLSGWARGPLAWAGRFAAVAGIILTASRSGLYLLLLCAFIYAVFRVKPWTVRSNAVPAIVAGAAVLGAVLLMFVDKPPEGVALDVGQGTTLSRVFDVTESATTALGGETRGDITLQAVQATLEAPWYGYGVFTFQGTTISSLQSPLPNLGAHDIYLVTWGETGLAGLLIYLLVLAIGIRRMFESALPVRERLLLALIWISYLIIGLVWHNQFTDLLGLLYVGLLFQIPSLAPSVQRAASSLQTSASPLLQAKERPSAAGQPGIHGLQEN
ncbi:MAG: O-antigen ligase family protein [Chloroflexota bacterium]